MLRAYAKPGSISIARSVAHDEGVAVVDAWITSVIDARYESAGCEP